MIDAARPARARPDPPTPRSRIAHTGLASAITVGRDTPVRAAISVLDIPSAASNTMRARCANPLVAYDSDPCRQHAIHSRPHRCPNGRPLERICAVGPHSLACNISRRRSVLSGVQVGDCRTAAQPSATSLT